MSFPSLPVGLRVYAIGDIHGRADLLRDVLIRLARDVANAGPANTMVVFLGDYIDRGPDSATVIEMVQVAGRNLPIIPLAGNHEAYLLRFLTDPDFGGSWFRVGGLATLRSYGVAIPKRLTARDYPALSRALLEAMPPHHLTFLKTLGLTVSFGDYLFVHAGIEPGYAILNQDPEALTSIRKPFLDYEGSHGKVIVHGHSAVEQIEWRDNRINIDTSAYATNQLTCLVLEGSGRRVLGVEE